MANDPKSHETSEELPSVEEEQELSSEPLDLSKPESSEQVEDPPTAEEPFNTEENDEDPASSQEEEESKPQETEPVKNQATKEETEETHLASDSQVDEFQDDSKAPKSSVSLKKKEKLTSEEEYQSIQELFGLHGDHDESIEDFYPPKGFTLRFPIAALVLLIFMAGLLTSTVVYGFKLIRKHDEKIIERNELAKAIHERNRPKPKLWGILSIAASDPAQARILDKDEHQIYTQTSVRDLSDPECVKNPKAKPSCAKKVDAWIELRAKPNTQINNLRITDRPIEFILRAVGYEDYRLLIPRMAWVPMKTGKDFQKVYTYLELDPINPNKVLFQPPMLDAKAWKKKLKKEGKPLTTPQTKPKPFTVDYERRTREDFLYYYKYPEEAHRPDAITGLLTIQSKPQGAKITINSVPLFLPELDKMDPKDPTKGCEYVPRAIAAGDFSRQARTPLLNAKYYCYKRKVKKKKPKAEAATPTDTKTEALPVLIPGEEVKLETNKPKEEQNKPESEESQYYYEVTWIVREFSLFPETEDKTYSVRLDFDQSTGKPGEVFLTTILPRMWTCTMPSEAEIQKRLAAPPEKVNTEFKDELYHFLCDYSYAIQFNLEDVEPYRRSEEEKAALEKEQKQPQK